MNDNQNLPPPPGYSKKFVWKSKLPEIILGALLLIVTIWGTAVTIQKNNLNNAFISTKSDLYLTRSELNSTKTTLNTTQFDLGATKQTLSLTQAELGSTKQTLASTQTDLASTKQNLAGTQNDLVATKQTLATTQTELGTTKQTLATTQADLTATKATLATTNQTLISTQALLVSTNQSLLSTQSSLTTTRQVLSSVNSTLIATQGTLTSTQALLVTTNQSLNAFIDAYNYYKNAYETSQQQLSLAQQTLSGLGITVSTGAVYTQFNREGVVVTENSAAKNPTWSQLLTFLAQDRTEYNTYIANVFDCSQFAELIHNHAEAAGYKCAYVTGSFENEKVGHALNAFITSDYGLVYVDCTGSPDKVARFEKGKRFRAVQASTISPTFFRNGSWWDGLQSFYYIQASAGGQVVTKDIQIYW